MEPRSHAALPLCVQEFCTSLYQLPALMERDDAGAVNVTITPAHRPRAGIITGVKVQ